MLSFSAGCQSVLHQAARKILFVLALNCFLLLQKSFPGSTRMKVSSTQLEMEDTVSLHFSPVDEDEVLSKQNNPLLGL